MPHRPAPEGVDPNTPSAARIYDYALGGKDNYAADRAVAEKVFAMAPEMPVMARQNREFLGRAVRYLAAEAGVRQFLDIGSGLPTQQNVHQVVEEAAPGSSVVYVDYDPIVVAHGAALIGTRDDVAFVRGDLRELDAVLAAPDLRRLIDFDRPVAVLMVAVLHFVPDGDKPYEVVSRLRELMAPGSYLAVSHVTPDPHPEETAELAAVSTRAGAPWIARSRAEIMRFLDGFDLVEPGLVTPPEWRPGIARRVDPAKMWVLSGVGRRR
ncbi:SAM-dependent methyltransferase [Sphaerisporangium sp. TRM90804]|uniref:SAM-dependent methyltransferase n=1 Tax=Sphaerisporangium sp. TRM90804 TaxID=3031113 RepID=UPI00244D57C5|nr:SAM-dependent methyltransferase [Sphaerisporangium sp. TRM90804]MDH2427716.1 SAM-dependent methyltransferase [Sphaerisporangium sp. TRM90804]